MLRIPTTPTSPQHPTSPQPTQPTSAPLPRRIQPNTNRPTPAAEVGPSKSYWLQLTPLQTTSIRPMGPTDSTNHTKQTLTSLRPIATIHPTAIPLAKNGIPMCEKYSHLSSGFHTVGFSSRTGAVYMRAFQSAASASSSFLLILLRSHLSHIVSAFAELVDREKRAECGKL